MAKKPNNGISVNEMQTHTGGVRFHSFNLNFNIRT